MRWEDSDVKLAPTDIANVVIGTAGHVDHGKTSLVEALTGVNADRWDEERERGITIDIGFASRELPDGRRVGFIDVPGHERFVRHMIAGAAGVDVVLLVIAADDGVMPQTREHVDILGLLGARGGVIAITKSDIDAELAVIAAEEAAEFARGTFLEGAPVVRVSSVTGEGLPELWGELERSVLAADPRPADGLFRMPVQRAFTLQGFGTVLTGVPVSGTAKLGDAVEVLPGGGSGRLRGIQSYFRDVEVARAGNSTGLNVSDVDTADCRRGQVVVKRDTFVPAALADVRLVLLPSAAKPLENGTVVRFHTGTAEVAARVGLLETEALDPGADGLAQLRLEEGVVFAREDRFIIRLPSPAAAMGGGTIIGPARRSRTSRARTARSVRAREEASRSDDAFIEHLIETWPESALRADALERAALLPGTRTRAIAAALVESGKVRAFGRGPTYVHARTVARLLERLAATLRELHAARGHLPGVEAARGAVELGVTPALFESVVDSGVAVGELARDETAQGAFVRLASHTPALGPEEAALAERIESACRNSPYSPPSIADLATKLGAELGAKDEAVRRAVAFLVNSGALVRTSAEMYFHRESIDRAREFAKAELRARGVLETQAMKAFMAERGGTSRKYLVQILEYFDRIGLTRREGDERRSGEKSGL
jgi:selenocysteine-specific elongation factor